jgi:hypothetical protein
MLPDVCATLGTWEAREEAALIERMWEAKREDLEAGFDAYDDLIKHLEVGPIKPRLRAMMDRAFGLWSDWLESEEVVQLRAAARRSSERVWAWQAKWNLEDDWIADAAYLTLNVMGRYFQRGLWLTAPLALDMESLQSFPHDGSNLDSTEEEQLAGFRRNRRGVEAEPVLLRSLRISEEKHSQSGPEDFDVIGNFDYRIETVAEAADRILSQTLRPRLIRALEAIESQDRIVNGSITPVSFRSPTSFEWLVRYQVLGESRNRIAINDGKDRGHVTREVNRLAALIGLELREERSGRPPQIA